MEEDFDEARWTLPDRGAQRVEHYEMARTARSSPGPRDVMPSATCCSSRSTKRRRDEKLSALAEGGINEERPRVRTAKTPKRGDGHCSRRPGRARRLARAAPDASRSRRRAGPAAVSAGSAGGRNSERRAAPRHHPGAARPHLVMSGWRSPRARPAGAATLGRSLHEVMIESRSWLRLRSSFCPARERDDDHLPAPGCAANPPADVVPVHLRHADVEQDDVRPPGPIVSSAPHVVGTRTSCPRSRSIMAYCQRHREDRRPP